MLPFQGVGSFLETLVILYYPFMSHIAPFTPSVTHPTSPCGQLKKTTAWFPRSLVCACKSCFTLVQESNHQVVDVSLWPLCLFTLQLSTGQEEAAAWLTWYFQLLLLPNEMLQSQRDNVLICSPRSESGGCEWDWVHKLILFVSL